MLVKSVSMAKTHKQVTRTAGPSRAVVSREHMTWLVERLVFLIIQTIRRDRTRSVWIDEAPNVSRLDPSGAVQVDAEHPARNRKVEGPNPSSGSKAPGQWPACFAWSFASSLAALIWSHHNPLGAPPGY